MIKRLIDIVVSGFGLILIMPALLIISLIVGVKLGRPVLFVQERPGLNGHPFKMYKFRSMTNECDESGELLPNELRQTRFGARLRSTSLDELPELWNVFVGDMSLVGPRPLLMDYLPYYSCNQRRRHNVRPGITGWAQINGRNAIDWSEKIRLDIWYIENRTLWLDLKILFITLISVVKKDNVTPVGSAFTLRFDEYVKQTRD